MNKEKILEAAQREIEDIIQFMDRVELKKSEHTFGYMPDPKSKGCFVFRLHVEWRPKKDLTTYYRKQKEVAKSVPPLRELITNFEKVVEKKSPHCACDTGCVCSIHHTYIGEQS